MNLEDKNVIINNIRDFLINEGLSREEAINAILEAEVIHIFEWDCEHDQVRSVEDYAAEAYEFWKAKQD